MPYTWMFADIRKGLSVEQFLRCFTHPRLFAESIVENRWRCSLVDSNIIILNHSDFARRRKCIMHLLKFNCFLQNHEDTRVCMYACRVSLHIWSIKKTLTSNMLLLSLALLSTPHFSKQKEHYGNNPFGPYPSCFHDNYGRFHWL